MEETRYQKCACENCGQTIQYTPNEAGQIIRCPRCNQESRLPGTPKELKVLEPRPLPPKALKKCRICYAEIDPETNKCPECSERRKQRRIKNVIFLIIVVFGLCILGAVARTVWQKRNTPPPPPAGPLLQPEVRLPKSINDLKIGNFYIEQKRGSDFRTAVGTVENASLNVHFGIRVDLDLLDAQGTKVGSLNDVVKELGSHESWRFVAQVNDTNAVTVKVVSIKENQ
ncbi:FxLYD domain-containing protein [Pedosphaera parvula]|uniref:Uncharacterized protein n=1 Tax=Pedosphaera parvula (strain Ellin514) TaxID=320771 RepID=B9XB20_PEDPL|nr:hypothetical protein Cflav_PD5340 [Pedosphaera parvula Ellin514]